MKRYEILKLVMLGFLAPQDQFDVIIGPEENTILESDGHTIWIIQKGKRHESITVAYAIEIWLEDGKISEIYP